MTDATEGRRGFLSTAIGLGMGTGLVASYGTFFAYAGRYLYPAEPTRTGWIYVVRTADLKVGDSMPYRTPGGAEVLVTRQGESEYLALSSVCPHLGCQVMWEEQNDRFFCPCHNGVFTPTGEGIDGPPKGMSLLRYPLKVENDLLYMEVPMEEVAHQRLLEQPGHDGCLRTDRRSM